jgi:Arylsulfotransferase (ASST)
MKGNMTSQSIRRGALAGAAIFSLAVIGAFAAPSVFPTGLTISKAGVQPGYVIFASPDGFAYAIDVKGQVAAKWAAPEPNTVMGYTRPTPSGTLLARTGPLRLPTAQAEAAGGYAENQAVPSVVEFDQNDKLVWKYTDNERALHHDEEREANGNTVLVCNKDLKRPDISKRMLKDDCLIEVDPKGKVIWEWETADHFNELDLSDSAKEEIMNAYGTAVKNVPATSFDWAHMNAASPIPEGTGNTDPRFKAGNIIVSYRHLSTIAVVDKDSKKIVWTAIGMTLGQHNTHMIAGGLPGAGHILVFDNGNNDVNRNPRHMQSRPNSRVVEIDPITNKIVWEYNAEKSNRPMWTFVSHYISSAERQPNGNTLICEGSNGRIFEVTPSGEIVWEFMNPYSKLNGKINDNTVFRASKVAESWLTVKK